MSERGVSRKELEKILPRVADELGEFQVFIDQRHLPVAQAPAQVREAARNADEEALGGLLAVASVWLPRQIEREEANMRRLPRTPPSVTEGLVPTLGVLDGAAGSELTFGSELDERVAGPTK